MCLAPFTNWPPKEWPSEQFVKIAKYLIEKGIDKIFILGSKMKVQNFIIFESELGDKVINRCGKQHILNDYGLLQKSRLFIGNDSSMMHMASLSKTPTIGLFGPTMIIFIFLKFLIIVILLGHQSHESLVSKTQNYTLNNCLMNDVSYNQVIDKIDNILNAQNF